MTVTDVALHCVICFEEFDSKEHYPVVLPCGHTYVCVVCTRRLRRCMECREPLFWTPPPPPPQALNATTNGGGPGGGLLMGTCGNINAGPHSAGRSPGPPARGYSASRSTRLGPGRYSPGTAATVNIPGPVVSMMGAGGINNNTISSDVQKPGEIPFPCPKNVVLMEMIEAKERQIRLMAEAKRKKEIEKTQRRRKERQQAKNEMMVAGGQYQQQNNLIDITDEPDDDDDETDDDDDDDDEEMLDPALSGMAAAFSGACGTYVVREPLGLVVLPQDPNRQHHSSHHQQARISSSGNHKTSNNNNNIVNYQQQQQQFRQSRLRHHDEVEDHRPMMSGPNKPGGGLGVGGAGSTGVDGNNNTNNHSKDDDLDEDEKKEQAEDDFLLFEATLDVDNDNDDYDDDDGNNNLPLQHHLRPRPSQQQRLHHHQPFREPFTIEEGQRVQVVGMVDEGVYQLARGAGYVVATVNQLVKVGGPMETSCKLEGMLQSLERKQREVQRQLDQISTLAVGLHEKIVLEQSHPEEFPVIEPTKNSQNANASMSQQEGGHGDENDTVTKSAHPQHQQRADPSSSTDHPQPTTPTKVFKGDSHSPASDSIVGVELTHSTDSTTVELGTTPRTPGPPLGYHHEDPYLEMEGGSTSQASSGGFHSEQYLNSPAHSCPMPNAATAQLEHPYMDGTPTGLPRYRVNSDDDLYGLGWAGALGCGSALFGERLIESRHGTSNILSANGNDILALSFDDNTLLAHATTRSRAAALAAAAGGTAAMAGVGTSGGGNVGGSIDSPLRSGGSFDGVNFRTGMSGHRGLNQSKRERNSGGFRRQIRMMSEHRGVAGSGVATPSLKRRTTPGDSLVAGCHEY